MRLHTLIGMSFITLVIVGWVMLANGNDLKGSYGAASRPEAPEPETNVHLTSTMQSFPDHVEIFTEVDWGNFIRDDQFYVAYTFNPAWGCVFSNNTNAYTSYSWYANNGSGMNGILSTVTAEQMVSKKQASMSNDFYGQLTHSMTGVNQLEVCAVLVKRTGFFNTGRTVREWKSHIIPNVQSLKVAVPFLVAADLQGASPRWDWGPGILPATTGVFRYKLNNQAAWSPPTTDTFKVFTALKLGSPINTNANNTLYIQEQDVLGSWASQTAQKSVYVSPNLAGASNNDAIPGFPSPVAIIMNAPQGTNAANQLNASVGNVVAYKYKLLPNNTPCEPVERGVSSSKSLTGAGYSAERSITTNITDILSQETTYTLCVVGKNASNQWQAFSSPTSVQWTRNTKVNVPIAK